MQPTEEQIKRFWGYFGYTFDPHLPRLSLDFLFKYAVPGLRNAIKGWTLFDIDFFLDGDWITARLEFGFDGFAERLPDNKAFINEDICTNPALALFWAIMEVIEDD